MIDVIYIDVYLYIIILYKFFIIIKLYIDNYYCNNVVIIWLLFGKF